MQKNENRDENTQDTDLLDLRKAALLMGGILAVILAVLAAVYLFADKTKASSDEGTMAVITPDRIEKISDEVSEQVLDTLSTDILTDMIRKSVSEELTEDKIYKVIKEGNLEITQLDEERLRAMVADILEEAGISSSNILSEKQKEYIQLTVDKILRQSLTNVSVAQLLTDEEKQQLEEQLKQELLGILNEQIKNTAYQLTDQDLAKIKASLNLENLIRSTVHTASKEQIEKLQTKIIANVQKSVKTPVKGKDYFTDAEIKKIQDKVLKKAVQETLGQVDGLTSKISEVKISVSNLTKQVQELKTMNSEKSADLEKLQNSIAQIHTSIERINSVTEELAGAVTVTKGHLEQVSGNGSDLKAAQVSAANLTIAEFVDILAGNDQAYTSAVKELNQVVKQLKDKDMEQDEAFEKSVNELESSLNDNSKEMDDVKVQLEKSGQELKQQFEKNDQELKQQSEKNDQELREQIQKQDENQKDQIHEEQKAREEGDAYLQSQADDIKELAGDPEQAGKIEGDTIFEKIGSIVRILSSNGIEGLLSALTNVGGADTLEEGINNINTDLTDARARVENLEKEKWYSNLTLLASEAQEDVDGYTCQESGSSYVYQIPLVTEEDQINLSETDTSVVVEFQKPGRLPSNVAFSTSGNDLLITFTNKPTRNIKITSIHVYKEK